MFLQKLTETGHKIGTTCPGEWPSQTMVKAHQHVADNFASLVTGAVVDAEFLEGKRAYPRPPQLLSDMIGSEEAEKHAAAVHSGESAYGELPIEGFHGAGDDDGDEASEVGAVHGPLRCERTCSVCVGLHHWIESCNDPSEPLNPEEDETIREVIRAYDKEHGTEHEAAAWACKHCNLAWAEYNADAGAALASAEMVEELAELRQENAALRRAGVNSENNAKLASSFKTDADRLLVAISKHHAQKADDRCWMDDDVLYEAAGLSPADRRVGDKAAMRKNCDRFIEVRCEGGHWPSYADLEGEVNRLRGLLSLDTEGLPTHSRTGVKLPVNVVSLTQAEFDALPVFNTFPPETPKGGLHWKRNVNWIVGDAGDAPEIWCHYAVSGGEDGHARYQKMSRIKIVDQAHKGGGSS